MQITMPAWVRYKIIGSLQMVLANKLCSISFDHAAAYQKDFKNMDGLAYTLNHYFPNL